jgi:hypothetical protein
VIDHSQLAKQSMESGKVALAIDNSENWIPLSSRLTDAMHVHEQAMADVGHEIAMAAPGTAPDSWRLVYAMHYQSMLVLAEVVKLLGES